MSQGENPRLLAISNIAWPDEADEDALLLASALGFDGIEIAPRKVFGDLAAVEDAKFIEYRRHLEGLGLAIPALQAILFGAKDLHLFESAESRRRMADYLKRVADIASTLGARSCVFGSPTLRDPGTLALEEALAIATDFFRALAPYFAERNVQLCFEANPPIYNCRFITETSEASALVERIDAPGLALQLDTGTLFANGEDPEVIREVCRQIGHFHVSEPRLPPIGTGGVDHAPLASALKASCYTGWISIEMRATDDWRGAMQGAYQLVHELYCEAETQG